MIVHQPGFTYSVSDGRDMDLQIAYKSPVTTNNSSVYIHLQVLTLKNFFGIYAEEQNAILSNTHCPLDPLSVFRQSYMWVLSTSPRTQGIFQLSACC